MISQIFANFHPELTWQVLSGYTAVTALIAIGYLSHFTPSCWQTATIGLLRRGGIVVQAMVLIAAIYAVAQFKTSEIQPFIYFQF